MANHAIVRLDRVSATTDGSLLRSVKFHDGSDFAAIDNGNVVALDARIEGERELYKAVKPTAATTLAALALIASPEYMPDNTVRGLDNFVNGAGEISRGILFHEGDCFSVTAEALDAAATVGQVVEVKANQTKWHVAAKATAGAQVIGKVSAIETDGNYKWFVIDVAPYVGA